MRTLFRLLSRRFPTPQPVSVLRPEQPGETLIPFGPSGETDPAGEPAECYERLRAFLQAHQAEWGLELACPPAGATGVAELLLFPASRPDLAPAALFRVLPEDAEESPRSGHAKNAAQQAQLVFLVRESGGTAVLSRLLGEDFVESTYVGSPGDRFHFLWSDVAGS